MRRLSQAFNDYERLREFKLAGLAVDGLPNQRQIGKAHDDIASERRIGWICPDDITIRPDRPNAAEVARTIDDRRDHFAGVGTIPCDHAVKMAKALQRDGSRRTNVDGICEGSLRSIWTADELNPHFRNRSTNTKMIDEKNKHPMDQSL